MSQIIHWQWVTAAFLVGLALMLSFEIRRRRQTASISPAIYMLPGMLLLFAIGMVLEDHEPALSKAETAVSAPITFPAPSAHQIQSIPPPTLPAPQISLYESEIQEQMAAAPSLEPLETDVHHLRIPALKLNKPVRTIPLDNGIWNVADLGGDVGWLETTAVHPDDEQAMVFVGHMTYGLNNLLEKGAFADIPNLPYGTAIILETPEYSHTYLIDSVRRVSPNDTEALYQESGDSILLLTCADWNSEQGVYENRLLVRASREP